MQVGTNSYIWSKFPDFNTRTYDTLKRVAEKQLDTSKSVKTLSDCFHQMNKLYMIPGSQKNSQFFAAMK